MHTFVLDHTKLTMLPFLSPLKLRLADEVIPVWEESERDAPPFWAFAWAGGQALARYLLDNPKLVRGKAVLDIASGCGVVAIAAARCGAASVIANEIDGYAVEAIKINAEANDIEVETRLGDILDTTVDDVEVILAGDVFYNRDMTASVLSFLERATAPVILVGDAGRAYKPETGFAKVAEYDVPVNRDIEDSDLKPTAVLRQL